MLLQATEAVLTILALCSTIGNAFAKEETVVYRSTHHGVTKLWQRAERLPMNTMVQVNLALTVQQTTVDMAEKALQAVSDPTSAIYGQHWSPQKIARYFATNKSQIRILTSWLNVSGVAASSIRISYDQTKISFNMTVGQTEKLLATTFHTYSQNGVIQAGIDEYSLPHAVAGLIEFITTTVQPMHSLSPNNSLATIPSKRAKLQQRQTSAALQVSCFSYMTPDCLRLLYKFPSTANTSAHPNSSFGIYETAWSTWLPADLDQFFTYFDPDRVGSRPTVLAVDGGYMQTDYQLSNFNLESDLDFEYAISLAAPLPITNIQVGDIFLGGDLNDMLAAFDKDYCTAGLDPNYDPVYPDTVWPGGYNATDCGVYTAPLVISISSAWNEAWYSEEYLQRQCLEFMKMGLLGTTVIVATGDYGTADQTLMCVDPASGVANVTEGLFNASTVFPPEMAFSLTLSDNVTVANSSGGFSNTFDAPFYQEAATQAYLKQSQYSDHLAGLSSLGYFDPEGRGYPDISAMASNVLAYVDGGLHSVLGTSAAAPVFASMIAKINDARLHAGKSPVGFINPVLYKYASKVMTDVTLGGNGGCGVPDAFPASKGWDAVTGLGTPDYEQLLELYLNLP